MVQIPPALRWSCPRRWPDSPLFDPQDLATLEQQYALLKEKLGDSAGGAGVPEERLGKLQEQAGRLVQDTADMLRRIAGQSCTAHLCAPSNNRAGERGSPTKRRSVMPRKETN